MTSPPPTSAPVARGAGRVPGNRCAKIVIAGGFGAGKTTLVTAVSEITPVTTEVPMSDGSRQLDDTRLVPAKATTTVAMDFGRLALDDDVVLYVFGTPGQQRFWFMWDGLVHGALGAIVLVDARRLIDAFGPIDYFEHCRMPFVVVVNRFAGTDPPPLPEIREALSLPKTVPVVACDARQRDDVRDVLICLVQYVLTASYPSARRPAPTTSS